MPLTANFEENLMFCRLKFVLTLFILQDVMVLLIHHNTFVAFSITITGRKKHLSTMALRRLRIKDQKALTKTLKECQFIISIYSQSLCYNATNILFVERSSTLVCILLETVLYILWNGNFIRILLMRCSLSSLDISSLTKSKAM